jgi:hypothetical protein
MIHLTIHLLEREATALSVMARHFQFSDAQHLLRHNRNVAPDTLCEAITTLQNALKDVGFGG